MINASTLRRGFGSTFQKQDTVDPLKLHTQMIGLSGLARPNPLRPRLQWGTSLKSEIKLLKQYPDFLFRIWGGWEGVLRMPTPTPDQIAYYINARTSHPLSSILRGCPVPRSLDRLRQ